MNMNININILVKKEFDEFQKYHKNISNIYFHIFCGFLLMTFLLLSFKNYSNLFLIIYLIFLLFTINNISIAIAIFIILFILINFVRTYYKINLKTAFLLFVCFYFLPDLSHYLTNEPSMLNINNITPFSLFTNIFYLLPFSILCLSNPR